MKRFFLLLAGALLFQAAASEPSAFGAGNLDSDEPYGLTTTEKKIVENRKSLQTAKRQSQENTVQLQSLRDRLDGFQTILEGLNDNVRENKLALGELTSEQSGNRQRDERITALEASVQASETNIASLKALMQTLATQVDALNANYVSKEEFDRLVNDINAFKSDLGKTLKSGGNAAAADPYASLSSKALAAEAQKNYDALYFSKAIPMYEELIRRNHKPAYAHFMIGEMWHYRKDWAKALSYYKESAARYDKASYMPTLMLHSAESMQHLGDTANAKKFLQSLRAKYPQSKEASEAGTLLNTL